MEHGLIILGVLVLGAIIVKAGRAWLKNLNNGIGRMKNY